jgi:hypothetical protein
MASSANFMGLTCFQLEHRHQRPVLVPRDQVPGARGARLEEEIRPEEPHLTVLPKEVRPHGRVLGELARSTTREHRVRIH